MSTLASQSDASPLRRLSLLARDIKLAHSVFALPFALLATFLAAGSADRLPGGLTLGLIVLCMVLARTVAMAVNRLADAEHDAANPRTAGRAIPRGALSRRFVGSSALLCAAGFVLACAAFWPLNQNPWPLILAPAVLGYLAFYSYAKRFTSLCHLILGGALALSPLAAAIAVEPGYLSEPAPWLLAGLVLFWVAGFDILYALQDVAFDRQSGLFSLPARLGVGPALWISRVLHALAACALLVLIPLSAPLGLWFAIAAGLTAALLVLEHVLIYRSPENHMHLAFFTLNGIISLLLGGAGIADVWLTL